MTRLFLLMCSAGLCLASSSFAAGMQGGASSAASSLGTGVEASVNINMGAIMTPVVQAVANTAEEQAAEDSAVTNEESQKRCIATCYDSSSGKAGCDVPPLCKEIEAKTGYFSNIDKACKLPAGTAMKFGDIESDCRSNAKNGSFTGMFQFNHNSCKRGGNINDLNVQAACMCDYVNDTRASYKRQNGGGEPSAGMYYLFHQQGGGCAMKLAFGGNQRAVDVIKKCNKAFSTDAKALKVISGNLPAGAGDPNTITAKAFADLYLNKFAGIDGTSCSGGTTPGLNNDALAGMQNIIQQQMAKNPILSAFVNAAGGSNLMANLIGNSGNMTSTGQPMNIFDVLKILGMEDTSSVYPDNGKDYEEDDEDTTVTDDTMTFDITTNKDGSKTVVAKSSSSTRTHTVNPGFRMYVCDKTTINVVKADGDRDEELSEDSTCRLITESVKDVDEDEEDDKDNATKDTTK